MLYGDKRENYRSIFFDVWRKYQHGEPLQGIETVILPVIAMHPEYQALLAAPDRHLDRDYLPEDGESNPFLHMALHVAIAEQLSIDEPKGIRSLHEQALQRAGDRHAAEHLVLECLAEGLWQMQRQQDGFDAQAYLNCIRARLGQPTFQA